MDEDNLISWDELRKAALKPPRPKHPANQTTAERKAEALERERRLQLREKELARLEPIAIEKLEEQLQHPDPRIVQAAAKMILDHKWGRPVQRQEVKSDQTVTKVVYESAAITYDEEAV